MKKTVFLGLLAVSVLATQSAMASGKFFQHSTAEKARIERLTSDISKNAEAAEQMRVKDLIEKGKHSEALALVIKNPALKSEISKSTGLKVLDIEALSRSREEAAMALVSLHSSGSKDALSDFGKVMQRISNDQAAQEIVSFIAMEAALKDSAKATLKEVASSKDVREALVAFGKSKGEATDSFAKLLEFIRNCLKA